MLTNVLVVVLVVLLLLAALRMWATANRLDRLHRRTEAAWAGLDGALSRRVAAVRAAAATGTFAVSSAVQLRQIGARADTADRGERERVENDMTRALADLPPLPTAALAAELADAGERIALARRFYNDAVRDTRALRAARFTRWFRLAGRATLPAYFEIADPQVRLPVARTAARLILLNADNEVLLFAATDEIGRQVWFAPGGGQEPDEDLSQTAIRETVEETGLHLDPESLAGPLWRRVARFTYGGVLLEQTEFYFAASAPPHFAPDMSGFSPLERATIVGHRWWSAAEMRDGAGDTAPLIYPLELADRLAEVRRAIGGAPVPALIEIS